MVQPGTCPASLYLRHQLELLLATKRKAEDGVAVVAILHDLNLAALFADRIVVMHNGAIVADGPPGDTINEATLRQVLELRTRSIVPESGVPFVVPHAARPVARRHTHP